MNTREIRFLPGKIEARAISKEEKAAGYIGALDAFIPYNSDSRELITPGGKRFVERLKPGVFARSLADAAHSILADVGHNDATTFARRGVNLSFTDGAAGLAYRVLIPDTTVGRDLNTNVKLGIIAGTSFEFAIRETVDGKPGDDWTKRGTLGIRTVTEAILYRVNPVTEPAYTESSLSARSLAVLSDLDQTPTRSAEAREAYLSILSRGA